jgi:hypothetical protein
MWCKADVETSCADYDIEVALLAILSCDAILSKAFNSIRYYLNIYSNQPGGSPVLKKKGQTYRLP